MCAFIHALEKIQQNLKEFESLGNQIGYTFYLCNQNEETKTTQRKQLETF